MSVSACGMKTNIQSPIAVNKTAPNTFTFPNANTHLSCTSPTSTYPSYPGVDSTDPNIYDIETHFQTNNHEPPPAQQQQQQSQQPRDSLPSPHLLLHSNNSSSSRSNRNSTSYSQTMDYSLSSRDQAMDMKPSIYSSYPHYSRPNYDYNRSTISSPCYESLPEPNTFNHDRSNYQSLSDGSSFPTWSMNSLVHPVKTEPRAEYVANTDTQQHVSCTDDFSIRSHNNGTANNGVLFHNRSNGSKGFSHSELLNGFNSASVLPPNHDSPSGPGSRRTTMGQTDRLPNQTKLSSKSVGRPCRAASTTSQPLSIGATSPLGSTTTMTPDSSTTGFIGNRFTCSSDDGEASPAPTCSSGCPQTPGRSRKPAPTLATGRRNLKGELLWDYSITKGPRTFTNGQKVDPDEADRRMKRRERNRKSAQKCRERKVQRTHELQSQVECLQVEASRLMQELESWRTQARQCVALLQHHCPGVAIPYLSCLNEFCPSFKDSVDSLMDILPSDNVSSYLNQPNSTVNWKSKSPTKLFPQNTPESVHVGSRFGTNNTGSGNNESATMLPSMNMIHSQTAPNRSKSLFGFSTPSTNLDKDSMPECLVPSECDTSYTTVERDDQNPIIRSNSSVSIRTASANVSTNVCGGGGGSTASASAASVGGPASASSSSSCSTYELSLPTVENSLSNLTDNGLFKEFNEPNRSRARILSGHEPLPNNSSGGSSTTTTSKPAAIAPETQTWNSQQYGDYSAKSMQTNASKVPRIFPHSFDSELTIRCDSQTLSSNRSASSMEGACYT